MAYEGAVVLAVVLTVAGAGAYLLLADTETSLPTGLASDSGCPRNGIRQDAGAALPPPLRTLDLTVRDGERFTIDMPRGFWAAHLVAEGVAFAPQYHERVEQPVDSDGSPMARAPPPPPPDRPDRWTAEFMQGWCFGEDYVGVFVAQGDGVVRVGYFAAEDVGMSLV